MALPYELFDDADALLADFISWQGPPPATIIKRIQAQTRPGITNHGLLQTGEWGSPEQITLEGIADTYAAALTLANDYRTLIGQSVKIKYNSVNWVTTYNTWHDIISVDIRNVKLHGRLFSTKHGLNKTNCGIVVAQFTFQPFYVAPPP